MNLVRKWRTRSIGDLCKFESGNGFTPKDWKTQGLPIIRIQNLNGSRSFNFFDGVPKPEWIVEPGDLLFAWAGVKGVSFGPTIWTGPRGVLNQHIYRIRANSEIDERWLYYALEKVTAGIENKAHGFKTNLVHVRKADITGATIPVPSNIEQMAVAAILACWDSAIERVKSLLLAKGVRYKHQLSSLISRGRSPRRAIDEFAREVSVRNRREEQKRVLTVTNTRGFVLPEDQFDRRVASENISNYKVIASGQYAYNPSRINVGSIARLDDWDIGVLSPMYVVFELETSNIDSDYFLHWLNSPEARQRIRSSAQGSVRETVSFSEFSSIPVPLPSLGRQVKVAQFLNTSRMEFDILGIYLAKLIRQKRGLMHRLLSGEIRLKSLAGMAA